MKLPKLTLRRPSRNSSVAFLAIAILAFLLLYRLGSLVGGLSQQEAASATAAVGWHGIYHNAFYLPLTFVRSLVFFISPTHGQTLTRLPDVAFGALAVTTFFWLIRSWHGWRTAFFATTLFATAAWTLHVSRLASFDVLYLCVVPVLLLANLELHRKPETKLRLFAAVAVLGASLYIPGLVWLVALNIYWQWDDLLAGWKGLKSALQRSLLALSALVWLPLLAVQLTRSGSWREWLGLPAHLPDITELLKNFARIFVHLFVQGPSTPDLWLARAPVLDVFALVMCGLGIYFYAKHAKAFRAQMLASYFAVGVVLVTLGGNVGLSILIPLLYVTVAAGIAYLLHDWLKVFPRNPLARGVGIGLVSLAIGLASVYNLRAYFVAWPHNTDTHASFHYRR